MHLWLIFTRSTISSNLQASDTRGGKRNRIFFAFFHFGKICVALVLSHDCHYLPPPPNTLALFLGSLLETFGGSYFLGGLIIGFFWPTRAQKASFFNFPNHRVLETPISLDQFKPPLGELVVTLVSQAKTFLGRDFFIGWVGPWGGGGRHYFFQAKSFNKKPNRRFLRFILKSFSGF